MKLVSLDSIFHIEYGNKLDLNKMQLDSLGGINFVSRSRNNLGVVARVKRLGTKPFPAGPITVTLGGTYLLSSFVQPEPFYTAQNIKVLFPKQMMEFNEKIFYCKCIELNRFKYTSHGREANRTLDFLRVPDRSSVPAWINKVRSHENISEASTTKNTYDLRVQEWKWFTYDEIFIIKRGESEYKVNFSNGIYPYISATSKNNGISYWCDKTNSDGNEITLSYDGTIGEAFYQGSPFFASEKIAVLQLKSRPLNPYIALFLAALIRLEKYRYNYGLKWSVETRMKNSKIKLPVAQEGKPDWQFMENYIKSLPYSSNL